MTSLAWGYMPLNRQLFRRSIAEALAELLGQKHATAKQIARAIGVDPSTAENVRKGHLSVPTLEKALIVEGRELWRRLGDEIFGETDLEYEERVLSQKILEAEEARQNVIRIRQTRHSLESRAAELGLVRTGPVSKPARGGIGGLGPLNDGPGDDADRDEKIAPRDGRGVRP
jgi:transcriptional regulator with XRE-family HTH domain